MRKTGSSKRSLFAVCIAVAFVGCDRESSAEQQAVQQAMAAQQQALAMAMAQQQSAMAQQQAMQQQAIAQAAQQQQQALVQQQLAQAQAQAQAAIDQARAAAAAQAMQQAMQPPGTPPAPPAGPAPAGYPAGFPYVPGGILREVPNTGPFRAYTLAYTIPAASLHAQLQGGLASQGWAVDSSEVSPRGSIRMRVSRAGQRFSVSIFSSGSETGLLLMSG